jgi:2-oxoglutarate ferredoxin oxidoreductase subunit beta
MNKSTNTKEQHPVDSLLHIDSMPSVWCSGCGIGLAVNTFAQAVKFMDINSNKIHVVSSGIGCTGKVDQYLSFKSDKITDSNVIAYATELSVKKPDTKVVLFLNDADFITSNIDDFRLAGKSKKILVIYVNNYIYRIFIENKALPQTPFLNGLSNDKNISPFNIPHLAKSCGAVYIARWTQLHVRRLLFSIKDALITDGFSVIEVISPCLMYYMNTESPGDKFDRMGVYENNTVIKHNEPTSNLDIRAQPEIIVGKFVWRNKGE